MTADGLKACRVITDRGGMVNVTLVFSASQALLAAKAGAAFVSPFVGRLDISHDGLSLIDDIVEIFQNYPVLTTEVLVASIRSPLMLLMQPEGRCSNDAGQSHAQHDATSSDRSWS